MVRKLNLLDRAIGAVAPAWGLERVKSRSLLARATNEYEGATLGRRAAGWKRRTTDSNAELNPIALQLLRGVAHDLVRNNAYAARAVSGIAENMVGAGITFHIAGPDGKIDKPLTLLARAHFDSTACDAEGRHNLYGLQLQAARAVVEGGASIARRRWRRMADKLPVPMQVQLLEPDYINSSLSGAYLTGGGYRIAGIEFDSIGRRTGYQMYSGHPGSILPGSLETKLVPASEVVHCFRADRAEQQHGATWFAPIIVRLKDYADYADAQLVRQKVAAAFSAFVSGDGETDPVAATDSSGNPIDLAPNAEYLEPGTIQYLPTGSEVTFGSPPGIDGFPEVMRINAHEIAAGLGLPYELLTGDLSQVSFISGRLGRLNYKRSIETWQWTMFIPQFCEPIGKWFLEAAAMMGRDVEGRYFVWAPPKFEMMDPASEVPAQRDAIRAGITTLSATIRANGEDPDTVLAERAADDTELDRLKISLDSDPRRVTQVGNPVANADQRYPTGGTQ